MTFEIVGPKDDKSAEEPLKVWLEKGADGGIDLMAQDEKGETYYLFSLSSEGRCHRSEGISEALGFHLDKNGAIEEC